MARRGACARPDQADRLPRDAPRSHRAPRLARTRSPRAPPDGLRGGGPPLGCAPARLSVRGALLLRLRAHGSKSQARLLLALRRRVAPPRDDDLAEAHRPRAAAPGPLPRASGRRRELTQARGAPSVTSPPADWESASR